MRIAMMVLLCFTLFLTGCQSETGKGNAGAEAGKDSVQAENGPEEKRDDTGMWMYAVNVGKADAILAGGEDTAILIDAGYTKSRGRILAAMEYMNVKKLDAVFVTHTDKDHTDGLDWLAKSGIEVDAWYASAMFLDIKEKKHPAVKAAKERGQDVGWLKAGDKVEFEDITLDVLAPFQMAEDKDDNNSLVMMLSGGDGKILLAGDMEFPEETELLESGADLNCDVLKVANHGDDDTTSKEFVLATTPKAAVISTSSIEKPETPDERSVKLLTEQEAKVTVTQEASGGILVSLKEGQVFVEKIDLPEPCSKVVIEKVVPGEDLIELKNQGNDTESLEGYYLVSDKGREWYVFPDETKIKPQGKLVIGTNSSKSNTDLHWDEKKVIHKSKTDVITLYDRNGMPVSSLPNGL